MTLLFIFSWKPDVKFLVEVKDILLKKCIFAFYLKKQKTIKSFHEICFHWLFYGHANFYMAEEFGHTKLGVICGSFKRYRYIYIYIYIYLLGCFYPQQLPTASNIATYLVVFCCYPEVATHNKKNKTKQNKKTLKKWQPKI